MISLGGQSEIFISIKTSYFKAVDDSSKEGGTVESFLNFEKKSLPSIITRPPLDNGKLLHLHTSCPVQNNSCPVKYFPNLDKSQALCGWV